MWSYGLASTAAEVFWGCWAAGLLQSVNRRVLSLLSGLQSVIGLALIQGCAAKIVYSRYDRARTDRLEYMIPTRRAPPVEGCHGLHNNVRVKAAMGEGWARHTLLLQAASVL